MATYVYRRASSEGATALAEALDAVRYRARQWPMERKARPGDHVICWGESLVPIDGVRILNGAAIRNKAEDANVLRRAGVSTIETSPTRPQPPAPLPPPVDPIIAQWTRIQDFSETLAALDPVGIQANGGYRSDILRTGVTNFRDNLTTFIQMARQPAPVAPPPLPPQVWLPRLNSHVGGNDLLRTPQTPDFWVKKEAIVREFRVHSFLGRSIRAGVKVPREGFTNPHQWIRSWDGGWRISYDGATIRQAHRDIAHAALGALGLDFGAVDIGERQDGSLIVFEVNRAPGLEGGTVSAYEEAIRAWKESR